MSFEKMSGTRTEEPQSEPKGEKTKRDEVAERIHRQLERRYGFLSPFHPLTEWLERRVRDVAVQMGADIGQLRVVDSPEINAFVFTDRKDIYVNLGLLENIRQWHEDHGLPLTDGAVTIALAHEMGHVLQGDLFGEKTPSGETEQGEDGDHVSSEEVVRRRKDREFDADRRGLVAMAHSGRNPREALPTLEMLHAYSEGSALVSTHPRSIDRFRELIALVESPDTIVANIDAPPRPVSPDARKLFAESSAHPGTEMYFRSARSRIPDRIRTSATIYDALELAAIDAWQERNALIDELTEDPWIRELFLKRVFLDTAASDLNKLLHRHQLGGWWSADRADFTASFGSRATGVMKASVLGESVFQESERRAVGPVHATGPLKARVVARWVQDVDRMKDEFLVELMNAERFVRDEDDDDVMEPVMFDTLMGDDAVFDEEKDRGRGSRKQKKRHGKKTKDVELSVRRKDLMRARWTDLVRGIRDRLPSMWEAIGTEELSTLAERSHDIVAETASSARGGAGKRRMDLSVSPDELLASWTETADVFLADVFSTDASQFARRIHSDVLSSSPSVKWPFLRLPDLGTASAEQRTFTLEVALREALAQEIDGKEWVAWKRHERMLYRNEPRVPLEASVPSPEVMSAFSVRLAHRYADVIGGTHGPSSDAFRSVADAVVRLCFAPSEEGADAELRSAAARLEPQERRHLLLGLPAPRDAGGLSANARFVRDINPDVQLDTFQDVLEFAECRLLRVLRGLARHDEGWMEEVAEKYAVSLAHAIGDSEFQMERGQCEFEWRQAELLQVLESDPPRNADALHRVLKTAFPKSKMSPAFAMKLVELCASHLTHDIVVDAFRRLDHSFVFQTYIAHLRKEGIWEMLPPQVRWETLSAVFRMPGCDEDVFSTYMDADHYEDAETEEKGPYHDDIPRREHLHYSSRALSSEFAELAGQMGHRDPVVAIWELLRDRSDSDFDWGAFFVGSMYHEPKETAFDRVPIDVYREMLRYARGKEKDVDPGRLARVKNKWRQRRGDNILELVLQRVIYAENGVPVPPSARKGLPFGSDRFEFATEFLPSAYTKERDMFDPSVRTVTENLALIDQYAPADMRQTYVRRCMAAYGHSLNEGADPAKLVAWVNPLIVPGGVVRMLDPIPETCLVSPRLHLNYANVDAAALDYSSAAPSILDGFLFEPKTLPPRAHVLQPTLERIRFVPGTNDFCAALRAVIETVPERTDFRDRHLIRLLHDTRAHCDAASDSARWTEMHEAYLFAIPQIANPGEALKLSREADLFFRAHLAEDHPTFEGERDRIVRTYPSASYARDEALLGLGDSPGTETMRQARSLLRLTVAESRTGMMDGKIADAGSLEKLSEACAYMDTGERGDFLLWLMGRRSSAPKSLRAIGAAYKRSVEDVPKAFFAATTEERRQILLRVCLGEHGLLDPVEEEQEVFDLFLRELGVALFKGCEREVGRGGRAALETMLETAFRTHRPIRRLFLLQSLLESFAKNEKATFTDRLRIMCESLGPAFVKAAQVLVEEEHRPGEPLLPQAIRHGLADMKEHVRGFHRIAALEIADAEGEFHPRADSAALDGLGRQLAAGSMKQVYEATTTEGGVVIEKFLRPSITKSLDEDARVMHAIAGALRGRGVELPDQLEARVERWIREEADLEREIRNHEDLAATLEAYSKTEGAAPVMVPTILRSSRRHIREEKIVGASFDESMRTMDTEAFMEKRLQALDALFFQAFEAGVFHADPHGGNIIMREDGRLAFIDMGNVGRIEQEHLPVLRRFFASLAFADVDGIREGLAVFAPTLPEDVIRSIREALVDESFEAAQRFRRIASLITSSPVDVHPGFEKFIKMAVTSAYLSRDIPTERLLPMVMKRLHLGTEGAKA